MILFKEGEIFNMKYLLYLGLLFLLPGAPCWGGPFSEKGKKILESLSNCDCTLFGEQGQTVGHEKATFKTVSEFKKYFKALNWEK